MSAARNGWGDLPRPTAESLARGTAAFHERIARAFDSVGRAQDAQAARRAAALVRGGAK